MRVKNIMINNHFSGMKSLGEHFNARARAMILSKVGLLFPLSIELK